MNDLIFHRMIDPDWSRHERAFVDKEFAKTQARLLVPGLGVAKTLHVIAMEGVGSAADLCDLLRPFLGTSAIAKPAHASGMATFLRDVTSSEDLRWLYAVAACDYAMVVREMQYFRLPKKVIVEALIPTADASPPDDYKFYCVAGEPLVCQIDHNRFSKAWSRLFRVPDFTPMHDQDGLVAPFSFAQAPRDRTNDMVAAARSLAAGFEFVRVDLYNGFDGVYFGEMTFTPAASLGIAPSIVGDLPDSETHQLYSEIIMSAVRVLRRK
ncbi:hypothetical protein HNO88_004063 [Novosphingobium chloroacetimidivorans]|uniref:ATP-grasp domain-containing protein n=1 Tax=Novosphingobium chloroacetimidivorans TaxID=1428314 RepID=A0A7W7KES3_9SPHN|nr:ATP-grasp fold amidoligase family protein [Novosphingobium chloroacetimidivorans]MBB4860718.1 hypothetical protein [Novosphingobium chloroacetimidivorans]